jgi:hypothetical protein
VGPKKPTEPGEAEGLSERLEKLEDYLKDYILESKVDDQFLNHYIVLIQLEEKLDTPVFSGGLLDRPAFWERYIRPWIKEGFQELATISDLSKPPV